MDSYADDGSPIGGYSPSDAVMGAFRQIESGGNPNAQTGSYKGLYQLSDGEFNRYGGQGSIFDPAENTRVAKLKISDEANQLSKALGRPVTDSEVYLAHQQGVGGATAHLMNPDQPAWQSMLSTGEGRQKGAGWAKQAIWGNIPDGMKAQFGHVDNVTSGQFANMWNARFARAMGQPATPLAFAGAGNTSPAVAAINRAAGTKGALSMADTNDDEDTPALTRANAGVLFPGSNENTSANTIAQGLTGLGAALASITNPQQGYVLNSQLAQLKKDAEGKYRMSLGKNGEVYRIDPTTGKVEISRSPYAPAAGADNAPQMTPVWGDRSALGNDPSSISPDMREKYLASMNPSQRAMVEGLLTNTLPPPTAAAMARKDSPYPAAFAAAKALDDGIDPVAYAGRVKGYQYWAGKGAENSRALNQTIAHQSGVLLDAMNNLDNTQYPLINSAKNIWNDQVLGKAAPGAFKTTAHAVVDEIGKYFKQNNLSDTEIKKWADSLPDNMSPEQQRAQMGVFSKLMQGGMDAMNDQRAQAVGGYAHSRMRPLLSEEGAAGLKRLQDFANSGPESKQKGNRPSLNTLLPY